MTRTPLYREYTASHCTFVSEGVGRESSTSYAGAAPDPIPKKSREPSTSYVGADPSLGVGFVSGQMASMTSSTLGGPPTGTTKPSIVGASSSGPVAYDPVSNPWFPPATRVTSGQASWLAFGVGKPIPLHDADIQMDSNSPAARDEIQSEINGVDPMLGASAMSGTRAFRDRKSVV